MEWVKLGADYIDNSFEDDREYERYSKHQEIKQRYKKEHGG